MDPGYVRQLKISLATERPRRPTKRSEKTGKQHVVIFAGGSPHSSERSDDLIVYSLP